MIFPRSSVLSPSPQKHRSQTDARPLILTLRMPIIRAVALSATAWGQMNGTSPDRSATETELTEREADDGREKAKRGNLRQGQEASSLRARRAELAERLEAARTALASARERREFMEEEAEQVCVCARVIRLHSV